MSLTIDLYSMTVLLLEAYSISLLRKYMQSEHYLFCKTMVGGFAAAFSMSDWLAKDETH